MSPAAVDIAARLKDIAAHLRETDHRWADWFAESVDLALLGVLLGEALGWSHGYTTEVRQAAQNEALVEMVRGWPAGTSVRAQAAKVRRQLACGT